MCNHLCVIKEGKKGICAVRENKGGKLLSLVYPKVIATGIDPIEKKPLYHLKPGSFSYSIAAPGCNFKCSFCQNANIAQVASGNESMIYRAEDILPATIVRKTVENGCESISYTYTEPTVFFELAFETARLAKKEGLFNIFVTNGYMSPEALEMISPYLDAANVDLKAFDDGFYKKFCKARIEPVKSNLKTMKKIGILLEITTLLIPGLNDHPDHLKAMAEYIAGELGPETPWHISRFHPCHNMTDRSSTSVASLEKAYEAGKSAGLNYVYIGNLPGQSAENTYCHSCGELLIKRYGYHVEKHMENNGQCPKCNTPAYGIY